MKQATITERFFELHQMVHPEGKAIGELRSVNANSSVALALYPFEPAAWVGYLLTDLEMAGWDTLMVAALDLRNPWLDLEKDLTKSNSSAIESAYASFFNSPEGQRVFELGFELVNQPGSEQVRMWSGETLCYVLMEGLSIASRWDHYPELHTNPQHAQSINHLLAALRSAWCESMAVKAAIEHEGRAFSSG